MRAILIGGNGFIGSHLADLLLGKGWQVVIYSRSPERFRPPLRGVEYVFDNIENVGMLAECVARADMVFHLAVTTVPQSSNATPIFDVQSNLVNTLHLLNICARIKVKNLIFLSSGGTVYGPPHYLPVDEKHPTEPISSYGIVKLAIEKYLQLFGRLYGLTYTIIRPSNPYGPRQDPSGKQGVIPILMGQVMHNIPITLLGYGEIVRDFIYIGDLARACYAAAIRSDSSMIYNIGGGTGTSLNELVTIIETIIGRPVEGIQRAPLRPFDVPRIVLDTTLAQQDLNWKPQTDLATGMQITWDWLQRLDPFISGRLQNEFGNTGQAEYAGNR